MPPRKGSHEPDELRGSRPESVGGLEVKFLRSTRHPSYGILERLLETRHGDVLRHRQSKEAATERQSTYTTAPAGYSTKTKTVKRTD